MSLVSSFLRNDNHGTFLMAAHHLNLYLREELSMCPMQEPEAYHARFLRELDLERDRPRCLRLCHPFTVVLQGGIPRLKFGGVGVIGIRIHSLEKLRVVTLLLA